LPFRRSAESIGASSEPLRKKHDALWVGDRVHAVLDLVAVVGDAAGGVGDGNLGIDGIAPGEFGRNKQLY